MRLHMPGHKGRAPGEEFWSEAFKADLTELFDTDDLSEPGGIIAESLSLASGLWGSENAFYLTGSSTEGILASVFAFAGGKTVIARNCHKSVYNAAALAGAERAFILPPFDKKTGLFSSVTPESVIEALEKAPDAKLVVITSPDYFGVISDVSSIAAVCRERGVKLLVDAAHGAHLGLHGVFPGSAVDAGADIVIASLHKTLPSLTQTGIALIRDASDARRFKKYLNMIRTSSPSYLLVASCDRCVRLLLKDGKKLLEDWRDTVSGARESFEGLPGVSLVGAPDGAYMTDPTKIVLKVPDGEKYLRELAVRGVDCEMAFGDKLLLYTGLGTTDGDLSRARGALEEISKNLDAVPEDRSGEAFSMICAALPERADHSDETERVPVESAVGRVCAEHVWAYPPGIPLICPGEVFGEAAADFIGSFSGRLVFTSGGDGETVAVFK
ncbi:MAG: aminotransferase class V-fold PLP-dependent enzyme [Clostridia bacterium]|nr:aminotransferase class V-fold PLP-dependent enzyme [Clostridia bacterium]